MIPVLRTSKLSDLYISYMSKVAQLESGQAETKTQVGLMASPCSLNEASLIPHELRGQARWP